MFLCSFVGIPLQAKHSWQWASVPFPTLPSTFCSCQRSWAFRGNNICQNEFRDHCKVSILHGMYRGIVMPAFSHAWISAEPAGTDTLIPSAKVVRFDMFPNRLVHYAPIVISTSLGAASWFAAVALKALTLLILAACRSDRVRLCRSICAKGRKNKLGNRFSGVVREVDAQTGRLPVVRTNEWRVSGQLASLVDMWCCAAVMRNGQTLLLSGAVSVFDFDFLVFSASAWRRVKHSPELWLARHKTWTNIRTNERYRSSVIILHGW